MVAWQRWRRYGLVAGWLCVAAAWLVAAVVVFPRVPKTGSDFGIFIDAARALRLHPQADIYQPSTLLRAWHQEGGCALWGGPHGGQPAYVYPPLLAVLLEPLAALPCTASTYLWHALNLVLWAVCVAALAWRARAVSPWAALAVAVVATVSLPLVQGLIIGQVHLVVLASCLAASALVERGRPYSAGAMLAFGAFIKYFPAFLLLYYLLRGQWRVAVGAAVGGAALTVAQVLVVGPQLFLAAFGGSARSVSDQSHGVWLSVLPGGVVLAALAGVGFVAGMLWARRAGRGSGGQEGGGDERLGMGWALCTMLLLSPLVWWFYLTWLLPAIAACLTLALAPRDPRPLGQQPTGGRRWVPLGLLALVEALICVRMVAPAYTDIGGALATLILWGLCGVYYLRSAGLALPAFAPSRGQPAARLQGAAVGRSALR